MPNLLESILGAEIVGLSRILLENAVLGQRFVDQSALVLSLADGRRFEIITGQSETRSFELSAARPPVLVDLDDPAPVPDPDYHLSLVPLTGERFDRAPPLPIRVRQVTEVWAGEGDKAFLVAITVQGTSGDRESCLDLCVETDEVEVMTAAELSDRLTEIRRGYGAVDYRHYGE